MDACRQGDTFYSHFDLPGVTAESIGLTVKQGVLFVRPGWRPEQPDSAQMNVAERPAGVFTRQVFLGDTLDTGHTGADYIAGVLTRTIAVLEQAQPRSTCTTGELKQVSA